MIKQITFIFILSPIFVYPAFEKNEAGAEAHALGNACVALFGSPYALYYNPANIKRIKSIQFAFSYQNFYGLPEISKINFLSNFQIRKTPISIGIDRYGNNLYQELHLAIGSSFKLIENVYVGTCLQYYSLQIKRYGQQSTWGLNLGFQYSLFNSMDAGIQVTNINQPHLGINKEELPQCFSLGFCYKPLSSLKILVEFFRDVYFEQDYQAGIAYNLSKQIVIRVGTIDKCNTYNLGFGFNLKNITFDYALLNHQVLGISHSVSLIFDIMSFSPEKTHSRLGSQYQKR